MATEGIYPQISTGSLGSSQGLAQRLNEMEREISMISNVKTFIGAGTITGTHIAALTITAGHITAGSITTAMIQTGAINAGHMQADSITVTNAALSNLVVTTAKIADGAILTAKIGDAQITTAKIGTAQVQTANIQDANITTAKIADGNITTVKIGDAQITAAKIIDGTITTVKIGDAQITNAKIDNLDGSKINATTLNADRLIATSANADTLLARLTTTGSLVASTGLSAVNAKIGNLVIDTTFGGSILVGTAGAARIVVDNTGITGYSDATNVTFKLDRSTGKVITLAGLGGDNKLLNSSAERTDSILPWVNISATSINTTASASAYHGARVFRMVVPTTGGYLNQTITSFTVGKNYVFSAYVKAPGASRAVNLYINWIASDGTTVVRQDVLGGVSTGTGWERYELTKTPGAVPIDAPATAVYCFVYVMCAANSGTETFDVDGVQLEEGTVVTGYAPKADEVVANTITAVELAPNSVSGNIAGAAEVHIVPGSIVATDLTVTSLSAITANMGTLTAGRISGGTIDGNVLDAGSITTGKLNVTFGGYNLLPDSSFEFGDSPGGGFLGAWGAYGGNPASSTFTVVDGLAWTSGRAHGTYIARVYTGAGGSACGIVNGPQGIARRAQVRPGDVHTISAYVITDDSSNSHGGHIHYIDSGGSIIGSGHPFTFANNATGAWARYKYTLPAAPSGAVGAYVYLWGASPSAAKNWYWDGVQLERGDVMTAYAPRADENAPNSITTTEIAPGSITTGKLVATAIDGMTVTGATIRTSATNPRIELTSTSLTKYDASSNASVALGVTDGLDLLAAQVASPPNDRRITWLDGAGGAQITSIQGTFNVSGSGIDSKSTFASKARSGASTVNQAAVEAWNTSEVVQANLIAQYLPGTSSGVYANAGAGAQAVTIIDSFGFSSFAQRGLDQSNQNISYQNSFATYAAGYPAASYRRYAEGLTHVQGLVARTGTTAAGTIIGTVPAPADGNNHLFVCLWSGGTVRIDVSSVGEVIWQGGSSTITWLSLDNIVYRT